MYQETLQRGLITGALLRLFHYQGGDIFIQVKPIGTPKTTDTAWKNFLPGTIENV